jgi:hypothetical protein
MELRGWKPAGLLLLCRAGGSARPAFAAATDTVVLSDYWGAATALRQVGLLPKGL